MPAREAAVHAGRRRGVVRRPVGRPRGSRDRLGRALPLRVAGGRTPAQYAWQRTARAVAESLREAREAQDVSVSELAAAVGVTANVVHQYESGRCIPPLPRLVRLAWALGVSPASLLEEV